MLNTHKVEQMQRIPVLVEELSAALYSACQIPEGSGLIACLGDGMARDNRSALESWVLYQLANPSKRMTISMLNQLVTELGELLREEEQRLWY